MINFSVEVTDKFTEFLTGDLLIPVELMAHRPVTPGADVINIF